MIGPACVTVPVLVVKIVRLAVQVAGTLSAALRETLRAPRSPADRQQLERWEGPARGALGAAAEAAWAEGRAMSLEQAEAYALSADDERTSGISPAP